VIPEDQIAELIKEHFPLTPRGIIKHLDLLRPIYKQTARHGHFGRKPDPQTGAFSWEKTDKAEALAQAAGQSQLRLKARPGGSAQVFLAGEFQVFQILLQRFFVELRQELPRNRGVEPADVFDNLTFVHVGRTFCNSDGLLGIGQFPPPT
jgi:hypothetical protein